MSQGLASLTVTLETVTPLFLGGADPRGAPELRAPAFRGALRYWLRALVGAAGEELMRQHEARLFGMGGDQATAGAISLHLTPPSRRPSEQPYSELVRGQMGMGYLWFAARSTRAEPERNAIMPGTFTFKLSAPRSIQPKQDLEQAASALWLLTRLGGIGARSRRFAGSVQVSSVESVYDDSESIIARLRVSANSPQELVDEISSGIQTARRTFGIQKLVTPAPHMFDVLHPERCQIFVLNQTFPSWKDTVENIGRIYQRFRKLRQPDYGVVKSAMTNGQDLSGTVERAAFGLPIPFFYRSLDNRTATLQAEQDDDKLDRRASPLWMKTVKLNSNDFAVVFTWFKSQFLPVDAELLLTERGSDLHGHQLPDDHLIAIFLQGRDKQNHSSLKDAGYTLLEVKL